MTRSRTKTVVDAGGAVAAPRASTEVQADEQASRAREAAIAGLYSGPLDDFVQRRNALAKQFRAAGDREAASSVKTLRKPSRLAWALNVAAQRESATAPLTAAVRETLEAHAGGGDVRAASANLRAAVRDFATTAADLATAAGVRTDAAALASAVLAVIGRPEAFDLLVRGQLVDVPDAGGLDFLASLPAPAPARATTRTPERAPTRSKRERDDADAAARDVARRAARALADARQRATAADETLRRAETMLKDAEAAAAEAAAALTAAEMQARQAEEAAAAAREARDRARDAAQAEARRLRDAEREHAAS